MSLSRGQELRSHFVRRLPSRDEIAARTPIVLTERDHQLLAAVHQFGFLTTELVELAFFPDPAGLRVSHCSRAYDRLRLLWLWDYLERLELPVARVLGGRRPFLYALGRHGVPLVEGRSSNNRLPVHARRLDRLDHVFVDHDLKAAALWANIRAELRTSRYTSFGWLGERELRSQRLQVRDPQTGYRLPFLPDGYFEVRYLDGDVQCALVEIDMGTLTLRRFRRKVRAFELALEQDVFRRRFGQDDFEVLVLSGSERRLESLRRAAEPELEGDRAELYSFATFAALDPGHFANWQWQNGVGETVAGVLYQQAHGVGFEGP